MALKDWESKEFQISKKANVQKNVCDAFEEWVVEGVVEYTFTLEIFLTIGKEVQQARDKFDNLEWQWCALKALIVGRLSMEKKVFLSTTTLFAFLELD